MSNKIFIPMINEEEKKEILNLLNENEIKIENLHINLDNGKYIAGMFGKLVDKSMRNFFKYDHFIESINDLSQKTKLSIIKCLEEYQKVNCNTFNPMNNVLSENESKAYYYMENALFREIVLWDSLAQLLNLYYDLDKDVKKVSYKSLIKELSNTDCKEINIQEILSYINEEYDITNTDFNKGIHDCICQLRHQMTHRYSIAITSLSENTYLRAMPDSLYKIAKDYNVVQKYLVQIINIIIKDINDNNVTDKILLK